MVSIFAEQNTAVRLTIAPELKEGHQPRCALVAHAQRPAALAAVERTQDVVLEQPGHAVVGESLAQLDHRHQPGGHGQVLGDMA